MWTFDGPYFRLLLLRGIARAGRTGPHRFDVLAIGGVEMDDSETRRI